MRWSPNMDLLAIVNAKGELALHRLTWQRVWLLGPIEEGDTIANLTWRPDGKLIAVIYAKSKLLCLIDIENKNIVYKNKLKSEESCTCISWLSLTPPCCNNKNDKVSSSCTGPYLPPLPNLNRSFGSEPERKEFLSQTLDILLLGQANGNIMMYIFGMFYCGMISVGNGPILEISGGAGEALWATWKSQECIVVVRLSCILLQDSEAFLSIAQIQSHVEFLMDYLSRTLMAISEAWETILLEMDEKLAKYAADKPPGSVAADFLELLMIGNGSTELVYFLQKDLTEKGLKKLGHSIDMCYTNIQKLVLNHLTSVGMALIYHLSEMRGMVRYGGPYEALGLKEETPITKALTDTQSFLAKTSEIQQVIDHSMRDYKAFIRWLYTVILRLNDEKIPSDISKISQQDLTYIAEFLRGFDKIEIDASKRKRVNLEKLGQYLRKDPLQTCFSPEGSEWASMLVENRCLQSHPLIVRQDFEGSLMQAHEILVGSINEVFVCAYQDLTQRFEQSVVQLTTVTNNLCSQFVLSDGNLMVVAPNSDYKILQLFRIYSVSRSEPLVCKPMKIDVSNKQKSSIPAEVAEDQKITDLKFYSQDYLSLLILNQENNTSCLIQLPVNHAILNDSQNMRPDLIVNLNEVADRNLSKPFQDITPRQLAVSGPRKVAAILSENRRKIRLLETEVDYEEEENLEQSGDDNMMDITPATSATTSQS
ncbi:anaphase-promoting complex subunit 4 isoform X2 [Phymastichus coffea]|nr:anaphase-promoting complex subunit 4 isoform X2 [Phymastichus coffea]